MATVHHLTDTPERLELAACLDPGAVHTLNLLAGQGLLIYQDDGVDAHTGPAEIAVDSLLARVNRLGKPVSRRLVVWRREPFDLEFYFKLYTFEYLPVTVTLGLALAIADPKVFVGHFLASSEAVTIPALKRYLFEPLAQTLGDYLRGRNLTSLAADGQLRAHLRNALLPGDLKKRLAAAGLQLHDVHADAVPSGPRRGPPFE